MGPHESLFGVPLGSRVLIHTGLHKENIVTLLDDWLTSSAADRTWAINATEGEEDVRCHSCGTG